MWVFNSKRMKKEGVHFFVGQVKIAEIRMAKIGGEWRFLLHLMNTNAPDKQWHETFSSALTELHRLLNAEAPTDHTVP